MPSRVAYRCCGVFGNHPRYSVTMEYPATARRTAAVSQAVSAVAQCPRSFPFSSEHSFRGRLVPCEGGPDYVRPSLGQRVGEAVTTVGGDLAELDDLFATDLRPLAVLDDGKPFCKNRQGEVKVTRSAPGRAEPLSYPPGRPYRGMLCWRRSRC